MKVGVIGGRDFNDYDSLKQVLDTLSIEYIVSGGAKGADTLAEQYADENNIEKMIFYPDYGEFGKSAPFVRNTDIANESDMIVAFWDGISRGTKDTIEKAERQGKNILIVGYEKETTKEEKEK